MRELTKNEKILLNILGIILIGWGTYHFIFTPQSRKIDALKTQKLEYQEEINEMNDILSREDDINKRLVILKDQEDEIVSQYFPKFDQAQVIYLLNSLLDKDDITILDMGFSRPGYEEIQGIQMKNMTLSVHFEGAYEGIQDVIKAIKNSSRKILVDNLSVERDQGGSLEGSISLNVYALDEIVNADGDVIPLYNERRNFVTTPFLAYDGYQENDPSTDGWGAYPEGDEPGGLDPSQGLNPYSPEFSLDYKKENEISEIPGEGAESK